MARAGKPTLSTRGAWGGDRVTGGVNGLREAVGDTRNSYCTSCYTGNYPVSFPQNEEAYLQLALKAVD